ncbi:MAG: ATPase domain-containing protein [Bryobacteraceae bacterium]
MKASIRASTGIAGLDEILLGGLPAGRMYLVEGDPGTGKTTIGLQFLLDGVRAGERCLYITLSETVDELAEVAESHGWTLDGIELYELQSEEHKLDPNEQYTIFHPGEVELGEMIDRVFAQIERVRPGRVVFDSLSEMRLLAREPLRFRRQILAIKQFLSHRDCTVLMLDDHTIAGQDLQLQTICHGVVLLRIQCFDVGAPRRKLRVVKMRGIPFREGDHDFTVRHGGAVVFPRLVGAAERGGHNHEVISSGCLELDSLLDGGLHRGASVLLLGPSGCGKSTISASIASAAAARGENAAIFVFEDARGAFLRHAESMKIDIERHLEAGRITVQQIDPADVSSGELSFEVLDAVENKNARVVIIDSLNGYLCGMATERSLMLHMHELIMYLDRRNVLSILIVAQRGVIGPNVHSPIDVMYLADTVILFRHFEAAGEARQAITVIKKRGGPHETTIREIRFTPEGVRIGEPLRDIDGILSGLPRAKSE